MIFNYIKNSLSPFNKSVFICKCKMWSNVETLIDNSSWDTKTSFGSSYNIRNSAKDGPKPVLIKEDKTCNVKICFYRLKKLLSEIYTGHVLENNIGNAKPTHRWLACGYDIN